MSNLPSIPDIPLELSVEIREILEPIKNIIDQMVEVIDPAKLPQTKPASTGIVWSDNGEIKVS